MQARPVPDDGEQVRADVVGTRLNDGQRGGCGDCGVDSVTAGTQYGQTGRRGKRLACGHRTTRRV
jgi:hypothetical protein